MKTILITLVILIGGCYPPDESHYFRPVSQVQTEDFPYKGFTIMTKWCRDGHVEILGKGGFLWKDGKLHTYACSSLSTCLVDGHYTTITGAMDQVDTYLGVNR